MGRLPRRTLGSFAKTQIATCGGSPTVVGMKLDLLNMSRDEKLRTLHELWEDLAREDAVDSPEWHRCTLEESDIRLKEGKEISHDWEAAKAELRRRAA
jgi:hypothetical protein